MYPEQVSACSGFLLLLFYRLAVLAEQLACAFRWLAGDLFRRRGPVESGLFARCGEALTDFTLRPPDFGGLLFFVLYSIFMERS